MSMLCVCWFPDMRTGNTGLGTIIIVCMFLPMGMNINACACVHA